MNLRIWLFIFLSSSFGARAENPVVGGMTPTEQQMITQIFEVFKAATIPDQPTKRPVFGKDHGCLRAKFVVKKNLDPKYRVGAFKGIEYDAWVRFANDGAYKGPNDQITPDTVPNARGMAVKLVGVPGRKILRGEEHFLTQDFVMQNHPIFFVNDLEGFRDLVTIRSAEDKKRFHVNHPYTQPIFDEMDRNILADPLDGSYWTPVPIRFGDKAIKYMAEPCDKAPAPESKPMKNRDFLRENLKIHIGIKDACFKFKIQFQTNEAEMPIHKATVLWNPEVSPFIEVAEIRISRKQNPDVDQPDRMKTCENLSMSIWHALPEHTPLGSINLARRAVYQPIAKYRRQENGAPQAEPYVIGPNE